MTGIKERIKDHLDPAKMSEIDNGVELLQFALQRIEYLEEQLETDPSKLFGVNRLEVIDESGRGYMNLSTSGVTVSLQDGGKTAKLFATGHDLRSKTIEERQLSDSNWTG